MIWLYLFLTTHITIVFFSLYVHRGASHGAVNIKPPLAHVMRFWLWLNDTVSIRDWVAMHRAHHKYADTPNDPHYFFMTGSFIERIKILSYVFYTSVVYGHKNLAPQREIEQFGMKQNDNWIEENLYSKYQHLGILILLTFNVLVFGWAGILVWLVQICWVSICTIIVSAVICHEIGYRSKTSKDNSRNLFPIGIFVAGEELHNNHHMEPQTPKLNKRWYEFDIGWQYIKLFKFFGLVTIKQSKK